MEKLSCKSVRGYRDRVALKALWREAFGEKEAYIDHLYACGFLDDRYIWALVGKEGLISACAVSPLEGRENCVYLSYAATFKAFRGRGLMSALIREVRQSGVSIALIPGERSLFDFYKGLGFSPSLFVQRQVFQTPEPFGERETVPAESPELERIYSLYQKEYSRFPNALYKDFPGFRAAVSEAIFSGDDFCRCGEGYGFVAKRKGETFLREPFGDTDALIRTFPKITVERVPSADGDMTLVGMFYSKGQDLDTKYTEIGYINQMLN